MKKPIQKILSQKMLINNGHTAEHGADNAEVALIGSGYKQILPRGSAALDLDRTAVHRSLGFFCKTGNGHWCETILIYNVLPIIPNNFPNCR